MNVKERPRRAAARDAEWRIRMILDSRESRRGGVKALASLGAAEQHDLRALAVQGWFMLAKYISLTVHTVVF